MKPHEMIRIEPIFVNWGTGLNLGRQMGATSQGGAINISKGVGEYFTVLVGAQLGATASFAGANETCSAAKFVEFSVYESTNATHAGSAITGATLTLGGTAAGVMKGLYDAFYVITSDLTTSVNSKINGIDYHLGTTSADGSVVAPNFASVVNGMGGSAATVTNIPPKLPHYTAHSLTGAANFAGTTGVVYIAGDDDQGTGLSISMSAAGDTVVPRINKLQGKICINAHALSTNTPKWLSVGISTYAGSTGAFYAFLLRDSGPTPGALVTLNT